MGIKSALNTKNILNGLLVLIFLSILLVPSAKALVIQGLMQIGLFSPHTDQQQDKSDIDRAGIRFKSVSGQEISLADFDGKVIFINFWATWCPPCLAEMPAINKLYQQFGKDEEVVFLMVDADGNLNQSQAYMDRKDYKMPVFSVAENIPSSLFNGTLPTTIVFDKKGRLSYHGEGAADYSSSKFINFIKELKSDRN